MDSLEKIWHLLVAHVLNVLCSHSCEHYEEKTRRSHECERCTQECVRHGRGPSYSHL